MSNCCKGRNLLLDSILITGQVETLCQINSANGNMLPGSILITRWAEPLRQFTQVKTCYPV